MTDAKPDLDLIRAAVRRFLADEHRILLRTLVRDDIARAVYAELMMRDDAVPNGVDAAELVQAAIDELKVVKVTYTWAGDQPQCGAEPTGVLAEFSKPCSLPVGHDLHQYPYPMPAAEVKHG